MHAPLTPALRAEWRSIADLAPFAAQWRSLTERALEPNVFYDPAFALAAAPVFGRDCGAVLVWSQRSELMGLFPSRLTRLRHGALPALTGWTHPYAPLGTPLVDRGDARHVLTAWLEYLAHEPSMPALAMLPQLPEGGAFDRALAAELSRRNVRAAAFGHYRRALLKPGHVRDERTVSSGRRKELLRQRRRLGDFAPISFTTATAPVDVAEAVEDFLVLEASGWKGIAGTAAADNPAVRRFFETAVNALAAHGQVRADRMHLGGRAVASAITLSSGDTGWFWKIAHNEGVARFSPGVQLVYEMTPQLAAQAGLAKVDSCATEDHPMIDHMWHGRLALHDRLFEIRRSALPFAWACGIETLRRAAIGAAKSARDGLRGRKTKVPSTFGAQQPADHLAGGGHRHLRNELDLARVLMRGQPDPDKTLNVGRKRV